jgi:hypothetical protein
LALARCSYRLWHCCRRIWTTALGCKCMYKWHLEAHNRVRTRMPTVPCRHR